MQLLCLIKYYAGSKKKKKSSTCHLYNYVIYRYLYNIFLKYVLYIYFSFCFAGKFAVKLYLLVWLHLTVSCFIITILILFTIFKYFIHWFPKQLLSFFFSCGQLRQLDNDSIKSRGRLHFFFTYIWFVFDCLFKFFFGHFYSIIWFMKNLFLTAILNDLT